MKQRIKPNLSPGGGSWVDPDFLPGEVKRNLLLHLKNSPLTATQSDSLLSFCNDMAQELDDSAEAFSLQRAQIQSVAANARRLLASLNGIGKPAREALSAHTDYLAFGTRPPISLPDTVKQAICRRDGDILSSSWDWISALEYSAEYAASKYQIDRQTKPEQLRAKDYLAKVANHIQVTTGKLPPKDRSSWFADFADCLCSFLALPAGPRIIASAVDAAR